LWSLASNQRLFNALSNCCSKPHGFSFSNDLFCNSKYIGNVILTKLGCSLSITTFLLVGVLQF
jgi:hypothetical protein